MNYTSLLLNFSLWVDTNPSDVLYVDYYNSGNRNIATQYGGHLSATGPENETHNGWTFPQLTLPTTTTMIQFRFTTGCSEANYRGVFIDLVGLHMVGPGNLGKVSVWGWSDPGSHLSIPVSIDNGPDYKTFVGAGRFNPGITFLASPGNYTMAVPSTFSDSSMAYAFVSWFGGSNSPSRMVTVTTLGVQLGAVFRLEG